MIAMKIRTLMKTPKSIGLDGTNFRIEKAVINRLYGKPLPVGYKPSESGG
jgi:hypothetical protein